jgi:hypothetical protein
VNDTYTTADCPWESLITVITKLLYLFVFRWIFTRISLRFQSFNFFEKEILSLSSQERYNI